MITRKGIEERIPFLEINTTHGQATPLSKVKFNACTNGYAVCTRQLLTTEPTSHTILFLTLPHQKPLKKTEGIHALAM